MKTVDDLTHDAETEAEVLRAVSHMTPSVAQEFLMAVILKIRRASAPVVTVTLPKVLAATFKEPVKLTTQSTPDLSRSETIFAFVRAHGPCRLGEITKGCQRVDSVSERNRVNVAVHRLIGSSLHRRPDGLIEMAAVPFPKVV